MKEDVSPRVAQLRSVRDRFRLEARQYAAKVRELVELERLFGEDRDGLLLELAGTARMGQDRAAGELDRALRLYAHFPRALALLGRGELLVATVDILLRLTKKCSPAVQDELGRRLPDRIAELDAADARPLIASTILQVEAELERAAQQERYARARASRGVWVMQVEDGMARIGAEVDALMARHFSLDLDELVRMEKVRDSRDGITRTQPQRRADVLAELPARHLALLQLLARGQAGQVLAAAQARNQAGTPGPAREPELLLGLPPAERPPCWTVEVDELAIELLRQPLRAPSTMNVHVQMTTALGLAEHPALVEGLGPIPGWLARTLLPDAALRRVAVNAATGVPLHLDPVPRHRRGSPPDDPPGPGRRRPPPPHDSDPASPRTSPGGRQSHPTDGSEPASPQPDPRHDPTEVDCPGEPADPCADTAASAVLPAAHGRVVAAAAASSSACREELPQESETAAWVQAQLLAMLRPVRLRDTAEPQHDPSAALRRLVQVRDLRCTGPGCPRTATSCDLDHELEYAAGGPTSEPNLSAKSPRCHRARHHGWTVERDPATGVSTWTSPDGSTFTRLPAWAPHPRHPEVLRPPLPRAEQLPEAETDYPLDRPLWFPPPATEPLTPKPKRISPPARGWHDGPPPF